MRVARSVLYPDTAGTFNSSLQMSKVCQRFRKEEYHGDRNVVQWRDVCLFAWNLSHRMGLATEKCFLTGRYYSPLLSSDDFAIDFP